MSTTLEKRYADLRHLRVEIRGRIAWAAKAIGDRVERAA
jgi:hypothetical protein